MNISLVPRPPRAALPLSKKKLARWDLGNEDTKKFC